MNDWENPTLPHRNRLPARACLLPYDDEPAALSGQRAGSPNFKLLNGQWKFHFAAGPRQASGAVALGIRRPLRVYTPPAIRPAAGIRCSICTMARTVLTGRRHRSVSRGRMCFA